MSTSFWGNVGKTFNVFPVAELLREKGCEFDHSEDSDFVEAELSEHL